jgi:hypothetical protein
MRLLCVSSLLLAAAAAANAMFAGAADAAKVMFAGGFCGLLCAHFVATRKPPLRQRSLPDQRRDSGVEQRLLR